jgi:hypothetical protein
MKRIKPLGAHLAAMRSVLADLTRNLSIVMDKYRVLKNLEVQAIVYF